MTEDIKDVEVSGGWVDMGNYILASDKEAEKLDAVGFELKWKPNKTMYEGFTAFAVKDRDGARVPTERIQEVLGTAPTFLGRELLL